MLAARTSDLPLAWTRLIVVFIAFVLVIIAGALGIHLFVRHEHDQRDVNKFIPSDIHVVLHYSEIQTTTVFLYLTAMLCITVTSKIWVFLVLDMWPKVLPGAVKRGLHIEKLLTRRLSSSTLKLQSWGLLICTVLFTIVVAILTAFTYTGTMGVVVTPNTPEANALVQAEMQMLGIGTSYRHIPYVRSPPLVGWSAIPFLWLSIPITFMAARRYRKPSPSNEAFDRDTVTILDKPEQDKQSA